MKAIAKIKNAERQEKALDLILQMVGGDDSGFDDDEEEHGD